MNTHSCPDCKSTNTVEIDSAFGKITDYKCLDCGTNFRVINKSKKQIAHERREARRFKEQTYEQIT